MTTKINFHPRLNPTISDFDIWLTGKKEFAACFFGPAGCGKTKFVKDYLKSLDINFIFCTVPDEGSYKKEIENKVSSYEASFTEYNEQQETQIEEGKEGKTVEYSCPYVIIDEAQHFISELDKGIETFQHEKKRLKIGEVEIPYNRIIFISHKGLGSNNSEGTRFDNIEVPQPSRQEIVEVLTSKPLNFSKSKAVWSVTHSKRNFRSVLNTSHAYGTPAQENYCPRGLTGQDIEVLWFYFRSDPCVRTNLIPESQKLVSGTNALNNCSAYLGLDPHAVKSSESNLKEEGVLSTGTQSKRIIPTNPEKYKLVLAMLKFSGKFDDPEKEKEKEKEKTPTKSKTSAKSKAKPSAKQTGKAKSKAKPSAKSATKAQGKGKAQTSAKPKQPSKAQTKSKAAPKMTGKSKASQIAAEINSDKLKQPDLLDKVAE